jgi:hypothetical protein
MMLRYTNAFVERAVLPSWRLGGRPDPHRNSRLLCLLPMTMTTTHDYWKFIINHESNGGAERNSSRVNADSPKINFWKIFRKLLQKR